MDRVWRERTRNVLRHHPVWDAVCGQDRDRGPLWFQVIVSVGIGLTILAPLVVLALVFA